MNRFLACFLAMLTASLPATGQIVEFGPETHPVTGHRYYRLTPMTWNQARLAAIALGGNLVTINSAEENEWVRANVAAAAENVNPCLIGFIDRPMEGIFRWSSGQAPSFTNWSPGEPNNDGGDEDFATLLPANGLWNDVPELDYPAIIEFEGPIRVPQEISSIRAAVAAAIDGQTILVGPGTYAESVDFEDKRLVIRSTHGPRQTIIHPPSGQLPLVMVGGQGPETILDGFTITGENTPGSALAYLYDNQVIRNCIFRAANMNFGVVIEGSGTLDGCVVTGFLALGVAVSPARENCRPRIQNCTIAGNATGLRVEGGRPETVVTLVNSIVNLNTNPSVRALPQSGLIIAQFTNTSQRLGGPGTTDGDPGFVAGAGADGIWGTNDDDVSLAPGSRCIDAGSNSALAPVGIASLPFDVFGGSRFVNDADMSDAGVGPGPVIDIGASEFQGASGVCAADFNKDGFRNPDDLADFITTFFLGIGCP